MNQSFNFLRRILFLHSLGQLRELVRLGPEISALVHEMQKERGTSAVYIDSKGKKFTPSCPSNSSSQTPIEPLFSVF